VSESTLEAPPIAESASPERALADEPVPWTLRAFIREHPWWTSAVALVLFSTVLLLWARTRPSYDAYGWLVWGHQTLHASLDLGALTGSGPNGRIVKADIEKALRGAAKPACGR